MSGGGRSGFTLVEVLVVLAIIGIAASAVVPALRSPGAADTAEDVLALYRTARRAAATRGHSVVVRLELDGGRYLLLARAASAEAPDTLGSGSLRMEPGTRLASGAGATAEAVFTALGTARGAPLLIRTRDAETWIVLDPWTGTAARHRR